MRAERRFSVRGFTLIEVLAALIIVSLGMLGVITAVGQTASNTTYLRDKSVAHWVAMNRLTEARLQRTVPAIDKTSDEVEMAGRRWRWTMEVTQTPVESIRRIDVKVRPSDVSSRSWTRMFMTISVSPGSRLESSATGAPAGAWAAAGLAFCTTGGMPVSPMSAPLSPGGGGAGAATVAPAAPPSGPGAGGAAAAPRSHRMRLKSGTRR